MDELKILSGAEPFLLPGNSRGVLLLHGFTGAPAEMRQLGDSLHNLGFTVLAVRLPGHGTNVCDMEPTNWRHWYGEAVNGYHLLRGICTEIHVMGLSMGGLLALKLAVEYPLKSAVALSAPVYLFERRLPLLPLYRLFRRYVPKKRRDYDIEPSLFVGYDRTPLSCLASLLELVNLVCRDLPSITCPVLLIQSRREHTVRPESAAFLFGQLRTERKELFWLEKSGHIVTLDMERERVFGKIAEFLAAIAVKE